MLSQRNHFGKIGKDGIWLIDEMKKDKVNTSSILVDDHHTGNAIIQVDKNGQNSIVLFGGTNKEINKTDIDQMLKKCKKNEILLTQNEISNIPYLIQQAKDKGLKIYFNPAPIGPEVFSYPLDLVDLFIINEIEGEALTKESKPELIIKKMFSQFPQAEVVLTLGEKGVIYSNQKNHYEVKGLSVNAVDTTAAGDTFIGYFITGLTENLSVPESLELANKAAAIAVTKKGALPSIPYRNQVSSGN
ncbi:MAG: PfkB family carbohydrate kinase [Spirochaetes bacterium]|nr:PfkB family carbohydrate kinase [Spirochaetota bacterium]